MERLGIEYDLLPWCQRRGMPVIGYTPMGQGGAVLQHKVIAQVAQRHEATPAQIALAWSLRQPGLITIPKAGDAAHVRANARAAEIVLRAEDLAAIDGAFPPPKRKEPLATL